MDNHAGHTRRSKGGIRSTLAVALAAGAALLAAGCGSPKNYTNDNDRLRSEAIERDAQIKSLESQRDELATKLAEANRARTEAIPESILAAMPRIASVEVESLRIIPRNGSTLVSVLVRTLDGKHRFVQVVGTLRVELVRLSDQVDESAPAPERLGLIELKPASLREAYRSGLGGTGYEARFMIPGVELKRSDLVARVELIDALTGSVHRDKRIVTAK